MNELSMTYVLCIPLYDHAVLFYLNRTKKMQIPFIICSTHRCKKLQIRSQRKRWQWEITSKANQSLSCTSGVTV